jgi:hypothetical protein
MRSAAAATGLAAALVLTACSGDGGGSTDEESSSAPSATSTAGTGGGSGASGQRGELEGSWLTTTKGKAVALIVTGEQAAVFETGGSVCTGTAKEEADMLMLRLKCTDGSDDRTEGMVDSVNSKSLTVTWEGGAGEETFQKAEGGKLPSGLPTANPAS